MRKKTVVVATVSIFTLLSLLVGQKYWAGFGVGLLLVLTNDWVLTFGLQWSSTKGMLGPLGRASGWLTPILYLVKLGISFVALVTVFRSLQLDLVAFAVAVIGYQSYRLVLMIFMPERYLESVLGVSGGR